MARRTSEVVQGPLTDRETTVLQLVAAGLSNQEIADHLALSLTTIKWYNRQIFNKLGANRRIQAVRIARARGLVEMEAPDASPVPAPVTPLIGREQEVSEVVYLLADPTIRLVTILGPGGIGKTHLALEVARQFPGQVRFVALEAVPTPDDVVPAIAEAISFRLNGQLDPSLQLLAGLRKQQLLLVLDNFEHLLEAGLFVSEMLAAAPRLKILTTSREHLNLRGETVFSLAGLAYPSELDHRQDYAAFQVFVQAARRSQPAFRPSGDDLTHVSRICQLVEGMPLALELAASWMDVLTPGQIADEIANSIAILQTTLRDVPERHRSMDAVFQHSWRLLSEEDRVAFKKLAVFRGGFDQAAAEQVAGASLFALSTLVDKSLVVRVGADRFKLHELLRQFAEEKLRSDMVEYTQTLHRHCQHYACLMQQYERNIKTDLTSVASSTMAMQKDFDNIMAAWHRALEEPFPGELGKYAYSMSFLLESHGLYILGEQTFAQALRMLQSHTEQVSTWDRLRVMYIYGWMLR